MAENLITTHCSNGPLIKNFAYNNDTTNIKTYDLLYGLKSALNNKASSNTNSINIQGASPKSWHISSDAEWQELIEYLGGEAVAGGKSKEIGFTNWLEPI